MRKVLYILGQLTDSDVEWLAYSGKRLKVPKGTEVIRFGVSLSQIFIVLDGELSVQTNKGFELARVSAGEILGEMSMVDSRPPCICCGFTGCFIAISRKKIFTGKA